jgi:hypothetical protein
LDLLDLDVGGKHLRDVGLAYEVALVAGEVDDEAGLVDGEWAAGFGFGFLSLRRLDELIEVGAEDLSKIGASGTLPSDAENFASGRDKFADGNVIGGFHFVDGEAIFVGGLEGSLEFGAVGFDRSGIAAERGGERAGKSESGDEG